jgi:hypothetical protein
MMIGSKPGAVTTPLVTMFVLEPVVSPVVEELTSRIGAPRFI